MEIYKLYNNSVETDCKFTDIKNADIFKYADEFYLKCFSCDTLYNCVNLATGRLCVVDVDALVKAYTPITEPDVAGTNMFENSRGSKAVQEPDYSPEFLQELRTECYN